MEYKKPEATVLGNAASIIQTVKGNAPTDGGNINEVQTPTEAGSTDPMAVEESCPRGLSRSSWDRRGFSGLHRLSPGLAITLSPHFRSVVEDRADHANGDTGQFSPGRSPLPP